MSIERSDDLRAFRDFANAKLSDGGTDLSLEQALALWEYENAPEAERDETILAIQRGLDEMHAGKTSDAFEFVERMRQKFQAAPRR